jgi:hypothetical protein
MIVVEPSWLTERSWTRRGFMGLLLLLDILAVIVIDVGELAGITGGAADAVTPTEFWGAARKKEMTPMEASKVRKMDFVVFMWISNSVGQDWYCCTLGPVECHLL